MILLSLQSLVPLLVPGVRGLGFIMLAANESEDQIL